MSDPQPETAQPGTKVGGWQRAFTVAANVHALLLVLQPILAGLSLDGSITALDMHYYNGMAIMTMAVLQMVLGVVWWRRGSGPSKAFSMSAVLLLMELAQFAFGNVGKLAVHLPLGIATMIVAVLAARIGAVPRGRGRGAAKRSDPDTDADPAAHSQASA